VSLVRSNEQGDIGFLAAPERVNVMLTRARLGMYVLGNLTTLTTCRSARGRELWGKLSTVLYEGGHVRDFLPLWCEAHKLVQKVRTPADFEALSPLGGCSLRCGDELQCGHTCPLPCHGRSEGVHATHKCQELVMDVCKYGHHGKRKCGDPQFVCEKEVRWKCHRGHTLTGRCSAGRPTAHCFVCLQLEARELELEQLEAARMKAEVKLEERKAALQQKLAEQQASKACVERTQLLDQEIALLEREISDTAAAVAVDASSAGGVEDGALSTKRAAKQGRKEAKARAKQGLAAASAPPSDEEPSWGAAFQRVGAARILADAFGRAAAQEALESDHAAAEQAVESGPSLPPPNVKVLSRQAATAGPSLGQGAVEAEMEAVLGVFVSDGALKAHDAVEAAVKSWAAEHPGRLPPAFDALRAVLVREVDPKSDLSTVAYLAAEKLQHEPLGTLADAVCCMGALLVCESEQVLMQAKHHAKRLLAYRAAMGVANKVPPAWLDTATSVATRPSARAAKAPATLQRQDAAAKWSKVLEQDPKAPAVMAEEILPMIGLEAVKENMVAQYYRIKLAQRQGDGVAASYNLRFDGNPGTGKTTIARLVGKFLKQLGVLPEEAAFAETSGSALIHKGVAEMESLVDAAKKKGGGVIFVDETYQLVSDRQGKQVLDFILPLAEGLDGKYGKLVWVFAGYKTDMDKLFEHNPGIPSRFPLQFSFDDYSDDELLAILQTQLQPPKPPPAAEPPAPPVAPPGGALDHFGNIWTPAAGASTAYRDQYMNTVGFVNRDIGTRENPVVSPDGKKWIYAKGKEHLWTSEGRKQAHYPGSTASQDKTVRSQPFFPEDESYLRMLSMRLGRCRGQVGFGNARVVRVAFEAARTRQATRIRELQEQGIACNIFLLTRDDLLGPMVTEKLLKSSAAYEASDVRRLPRPNPSLPSYRPCTASRSGRTFPHIPRASRSARLHTHAAID
jgi:hypothetical protein